MRGGARPKAGPRPPSCGPRGKFIINILKVLGWGNSCKRHDGWPIGRRVFANARAGEPEGKPGAEENSLFLGPAVII